MKEFRNILFVSQGLTDESDALQQALSVALANQADLRALIVFPEFPSELAVHRDHYAASLAGLFNGSLQKARERTGIGESDVPVQVDMESGSAPAVRIVRQVLKNAHDLLIKGAQVSDSGTGFKAMDMELLRKCPAPVWLSRPIGRRWAEMKVAVAIDPLNREPEGRDLSLRLLKLSRALADACNDELTIISCWDYPYEEYLRGNIWIKMEDDEILSAVIKAQQLHRAALDDVIKRSGIQGNLQICHVRGQTDHKIPEMAADKHIDLLVMGTVARTGIPGFVIGNTAEDIVQKLGCSLLALKPNGFVSPVKAY